MVFDEVRKEDATLDTPWTAVAEDNKIERESAADLPNQNPTPKECPTSTTSCTPSQETEGEASIEEPLPPIDPADVTGPVNTYDEETIVVSKLQPSGSELCSNLIVVC